MYLNKLALIGSRSAAVGRPNETLAPISPVGIIVVGSIKLPCNEKVNKQFLAMDAHV